MPRNTARHQKKLMKKRQNDKLRKKKQAASIPFELISPKKKVLMARTFPFYECLINPSWKEEGLVTILISRRQPDNHLAFGVFLVDTYCLGLKNTFCNADLALSSYKRDLLDKAYPEEKPIECPIPLAHHIICGGIAFAEQFGFKPNKDFKQSRYILDDKANVEPCEGIEFGKDGKPFFISGPDDNVEHIMRQLASKAGDGNFDYVVKATGNEQLRLIE
ncbi:MAG: hypothetical protein DRP56_00500 [Planctomycetota bacterium]|nr:MAG: hypothetical protein DRP56_00500 [Planctomycetota bacterium]